MDFIFSAVSIEDNPEDAARLQGALREAPSYHYAGNATTFAQGCELIQRVHPDLLFLDIDLPDANGLEKVSELRALVTWPMQIVFYTVHDNFAIEALRNAAFDYLIKPLRPQELQDLLQRFAQGYNERFQTMGSTMADRSDSARESIVMINSIQGYQQIRLTDVVYLWHIPHTKYWRVHLSDGSTQTLKKETSAQTILSMHGDFAQVNQSQIINLSYLSVLRRDSCTLLPPFDGVEVPVSRSFLPALMDRMRFI